MLEKWEKIVDSGKAFGALLTDLSKAFDCLDGKLRKLPIKQETKN